MIQGPIYQKDIIIIYIYTYIWLANIRAPKYIKKILMDIKGQIDRDESNTIKLGDVTTPFSTN